MKPKFYRVLEMAIDSGVSLGLHRAYKHDDNPSEDTIREHISREVLNELHEWFNIDPDEYGNVTL